MASGLRSEVNEVLNVDEENQMRRSKAQVFRKDLDREDILKEPLTIYFHSMMTFSNEKCNNKQELVESDSPSQVASDANILSNLMIYHLEQNKPEKPDENLNLPIFSTLNQDEQHGFIADLNSIIQKNEETSESKDGKGVQTRLSCILPKTVHQYETSDLKQVIKDFSSVDTGV